jgi:hypothetical protein
VAIASSSLGLSKVFAALAFFSFGLKPETDGDLDLETIDGDRDEERDLRNAGGGIPGAGS